MMKFLKALSASLLFTAVSTANATPFVNGGFENGDTAGWTTGGGYRGSILNTNLNTAAYLPGGSANTDSGTRSSIVTAGTVDSNIGAALGSTVYSGHYAYRAEDETYGGYASVISQKVTNYTDANIFFAWKAVLQNGGHAEDESAEMLIQLHDDTTNTLLINRVYNAGDGGGGVDARFSSLGNYFYTPKWQIEQLAIDASLSGHDFTLSLLAADCEPTAHTGYAYLDGFGVAAPTGDVPEPASVSLLMLGAGCALAARRRKKAAC